LAPDEEGLRRHVAMSGSERHAAVRRPYRGRAGRL